MVSIDKNQWYENIFARVLVQEDLIRQPLTNYPELTNKEKDQLRQTQVFERELVQVLGVYESFSLVRKYENTLGWMLSQNLQDTESKNFEIPENLNQSALEFLSSWKGTIYEFGGLSKQGIDCSGFTQLYYLNVHGMVLPKNSRDQRKLGVQSSLNNIKDHDLIFCRPLPDLIYHHVVLFFSNQFWHSRRNGGVICQTREEFLKEFKVEDVRTMK
jgi:cell wall-associated NlpC family hydrolase